MPPRPRNPRPKATPAMAKIDLDKPEPVGVAAVAALDHPDEPDQIVIGDFVWRRVPDSVDCPDGWSAALAWHVDHQEPAS